MAVDSEAFVASSMLLDPVHATLVAELGITPNHFPPGHTRTVVSMVMEAFAEGYSPSTEVIVTKLKERSLFPGQEQWGEFLSAGWTESKSDVEFHVGVVKRNWKIRSATLSSARLLEILTNDELDDKGKLDKIAQATSFLLGLNTSDINEVFDAMAMGNTLEYELEHGSQEPPRVKTGLNGLDAISGGLVGSRVFTVAGQTNHGKSLTTDQMIIGVARIYQKRGEKKYVIKFDAENSPHDNKVRFVSAISCDYIDGGVPKDDIERHIFGGTKLGGPQLLAVKEALAEFKELPIVIDHTAGPDIAYMNARCRAVQAKGEIGLIIFDYLELSGEKGKKNEAVDLTMFGLHNMAVNFQCPVGAVSQLKSRSTERENGIPVLADLSWSDFIKKVSAQVYMVFHPWEHWNSMGRLGTEPPADVYWIFVRKNKGNPGAAMMHINRGCLRLYDLPENMPF